MVMEYIILIDFYFIAGLTKPLRKVQYGYTNISICIDGSRFSKTVSQYESREKCRNSSMHQWIVTILDVSGVATDICLPLHSTVHVLESLCRDHNVVVLWWW